MHAKKGEKLSITEMRQKLAAAQRQGDTETSRQVNFAINSRGWKK